MNAETTTDKLNVDQSVQDFDMNKPPNQDPDIVAYEFDEVLEDLFENADIEGTDEKASVCSVLQQLRLCECKMFGIDGADEASQRHVHRSTKALRKFAKKYIYSEVPDDWEASVDNRRSVMITLIQPTGLLHVSTQGVQELEIVEAFYGAAIDVFKDSGGSLNDDAVNAKIREVMQTTKQYVVSVDRP
jgi:hypothetical protein